jgi:DNA-binding CsgD family transcriptional regulator
MGTRMTENSLHVTVPRNRTGSDVHKTVRQLVKQVGEGAISPSLPNAQLETREVLLEEEVDGVRYLLVRSHAKPPSAQTLLSPREQEIARMVAKGHPNKVIAAVLDISPWTVSTHLRRIFAKLNVGSRAAMVAHLLEDGGMNGPSAALNSADLAALRHRKV